MPLDKANSFGLLVGVGKREADTDPMSITAKDAEYLQKTLSATNILAAENTTLLVNENAASANILSALDKLALTTKQKPAGLVVVYFSGHGYRKEDDYFMICRDTTTENTATHAIPGNLFAEKLAAIRCNSMLVLLDCCHSAGMTDKEIPFDEKVFLEPKNKNRVIITACKKDRLSYLSSPVSLFTYALIEGLSGKLLTGEAREVNVLSLAMDVRERVVALSGTALKLPQPQQPQLNVLPESETTNFTLCVYPNGRPAKIPLLEQELAGLRDENGKGIDLAVKSEPEPAYRNQFNWMQTNNMVQDIGNDNIVIQDVKGNITINKGMSENSLREALSVLAAPQEKVMVALTALLQKLDDAPSGALLQKVTNLSKLQKQEIELYENNLGLLLDRLKALTRAEILAYDIMKKISLQDEISQTNRQITDMKKQLANLRG